MPHGRARSRSVGNECFIDGVDLGDTIARGGGQDPPAEISSTGAQALPAPAAAAVDPVPASEGERRPNVESTADSPTTAPRSPPAGSVYARPRHFAWADLLRRTFEIDILACPDCGGRLRLLATIEDAEVIRKILTHLNLPLEPPPPAPARQLDWLTGAE